MPRTHTLAPCEQERDLEPLVRAVELVTTADATFRRMAGIGVRDALVLVALGDRPVRVGVLASRAGLPLPTASRVVDRLVERAVAARVEGDGDRRVVQVVLTPEGHRLRCAALAAMARVRSRDTTETCQHDHRASADDRQPPEGEPR